MDCGGGAAIPMNRTAETEVQYMKLDAKGLETAKLAENILPKRMVVVTGSVPYKKQLDYYAGALRANSPLDLPAVRQAATLWPHPPPRWSR